MKPLILLADDNEEILEFLEHELNEKYTIIKALDGKEALELLKENAVQLLISDVVMPIMDGFELCKLIKTNFDYSHIPVILLTAKNTLQAKIEGLELGADAYIEQPFSQEYLQVQISNLLSNRNKIKEYFLNLLEEIKKECLQKYGNDNLVLTIPFIKTFILSFYLSIRL